MFLRLFFAFLAFGVLTSAAVGLLILERGSGNWAPSLVGDLLPIALVAAALAVGPAWFFALNFVRPFAELRTGAERIAQGEYDQRIHGGVWRESRELAQSFNEMSAKLADQIERLDNERHQLRAILGGMAEGVVAVGRGQRAAVQRDRHRMALAVEREADPVDRLDHAVVGAEAGPQVTNVEDRHQASLIRGSMTAYNRSTMRLKMMMQMHENTTTPMITGRSKFS